MRPCAAGGISLLLGTRLAGGRRGGHSTLKVAAAAGLVSLTIEVLQVWLPTRQSDTMDMLSNALGAWVGAELYRRILALGDRGRIL